MRRHNSYLWLAGLLILASLPARFARMSDSIWMDEAWVANSVMQRSLHDVFFYAGWSQSSPPLFLILERWCAAIFGPSEVALRILPVAASLLGLLVAAFALRKWLSLVGALCGLTLLCESYYLIKYSEQLKQYGTDFLVSGVLLWLVGRHIEGRSWKTLVALISASMAALFLSYTAVFWLPTLVLVAGLGNRRCRPARMAGTAIWLGGLLALIYLTFITPNRTPELIASLKPDYLDPHRPLGALLELMSSIGLLLIPARGFVITAVGLALTVVGVVVSARAVPAASKGEGRSLLIVVAGAVPLICTVAAGFLGLYPVLHFPRMLLFAMPSLALLLGGGVDLLLEIPFLKQREGLAQAAVFCGCLAVVAASQLIFFVFERPQEQNRPAIALIQSQMAGDDLLYVHGGMYEQFRYYEPVMGFHPQHVYVGKEDWACCATGDREAASMPSAKDFEADLSEAAHRSAGHRLWILIPAGRDGHWSSTFRQKIEAIQGILGRDGCPQVVQKLYGQTLVESFSCK